MPGSRVVAGDRVTLRPIEPDDVPFLQRGYTDPALRHPMGSPVRTQSEIESSLKENDADAFVVCREDADVPGQPDEDVERIGFVSVQDTDWKRPELGYWLVPEVHGEGYGREAVTLLVEYTFRTYDAPAIGAVAYDFNDASQGLLESLGFVEEGRCRKFMYVDGAHRDMVAYGLLREEWERGWTGER